MGATDAIRVIHAGSRHHLRPGCPGRVVGVYRHACNLILGEQWLALVDGTSGPAPATLLLRAGFPFADTGWTPGTPVRILPGPVLHIGRHRLDVASAATWHPPPPPAPLPPARLAANLERLARQLLATTPDPTGTGPAGPSPMESPGQAAPLEAPAKSALLAVTLGVLGYTEPPPPDDGAGRRWRSHCRERVRMLAAALFSTDHTGLAVAVPQLSGLGPGLTPAGDDLLAGLCLTLVRAGATAPAGALASALAGAVTATTPLAREMIRWALDGEAAAHLLALVDDAIAEPAGVQAAAVATTLRHGATSGADWTAGVLLGLSWLAGNRVAAP